MRDQWREETGGCPGPTPTTLLDWMTHSPTPSPPLSFNTNFPIACSLIYRGPLDARGHRTAPLHAPEWEFECRRHLLNLDTHFRFKVSLETRAQGRLPWPVERAPLDAVISRGAARHSLDDSPCQSTCLQHLGGAAKSIRRPTPTSSRPDVRHDLGTVDFYEIKKI